MTSHRNTEAQPKAARFYTKWGVRMDGIFWLKYGERFPYDAPDAWWSDGSDDRPPLIPSDAAHKAARAIVASLQDRRGIKNGFDEVDEDVRREIIEDIAQIIRAATEGNQ